MAVVGGPNLVSDGLVLYLDAANAESYPGSGSTWTDLSGKNNHATMYGTVPYETDVTTCFNFATATGVASSVSTLGFTFGSNMIPTTGDFTFSCWIKNPNTNSGQVGLFSNAGGGDGYRFGVGLNGIYYLVGPGYKEETVPFSSTLLTALWYNVTTVYARTTTQILVYLNGVLQNTSTIPVQTAMQNGTPGIVRSSCCGVYTGKLASFSAYNSALSAAEILQNYNALKSRFGL